MLALLALLGAAPQARAEVPLPSFERHLGIQEWLAVNAHIERAAQWRAQRDERNPTRAAEFDREADTQLRQAIAKAEAYESTVSQTSGLAYLRGLCWRLLDDDTRAQAEWRRSIKLDPEGAVDAYHDLGELLISQQQWSEADQAFSKVSAQVTTGPQAWRGPLRQAEVAGWRHDDRTLEAHLTEAIRRGFNMAWIRNEPQWRTFYADPALHRTVEKMVIIYADRDVLQSLQPN